MRSLTGGASRSIARRCGCLIRSPRRRLTPSRPCSAISGASARIRPGCVNSSKIIRRWARSRAGARPVALDLRAHPLDQPVVLDAGRARGHAGHAAEAVVEVLGHLRGDLVALLVTDPHEHDPPARRVVLVLEHLVARARRQAEAAVHAVLDQVQLGRLVLVPGDRHVRCLPRRRPGGRSARGRSAP